MMRKMVTYELSKHDLMDKLGIYAVEVLAAKVLPHSVKDDAPALELTVLEETEEGD
jgi:hypothetical protein